MLFLAALLSAAAAQDWFDMIKDKVSAIVTGAVRAGRQRARPRAACGVRRAARVVVRSVGSARARAVAGAADTCNNKYITGPYIESVLCGTLVPPKSRWCAAPRPRPRRAFAIFGAAHCVGGGGAAPRRACVCPPLAGCRPAPRAAAAAAAAAAARRRRAGSRRAASGACAAPTFFSRVLVAFFF
jgi:hypothetical protein